MDLKCALIIPDMHIPYHHKRATQLMLEVAKHVKVSEIVILGDLAEFYFASGHGPKTPYMLKLIKSMALFQEWIHRGDSLQKMEAICRKRIKT